MDHRRKLISAQNSKSPITEQYRTLRTNLHFTSIDKELKTLMVTSTGPSEGKSTTAANLAVVFAQQGKNVLLVDADLRKPTVHYTFNLTNTSGLTSILTRQLSLDEAIVESKISSLYLLPSGPIPPNPAELMASGTMEQFLENASREFDLVIFDTPPVMAVTDSQILSNKCDGTILVVSCGKTLTEEAIKAKELLVSAKANVLGVVLNNKKLKNPSYYYYGS
ncbi:CpsD/CapB family tyrosine-protein kinase [Mesobacillus subterraneus]|uniref:non-specific protein-tyrosine kinase n=1 Tax=Mesobacillus subterraneus TaxID=285983 RepID=A0A427TS48_9BACI|nr:CpsD/CapB family tyrosine-protein kinase [Mesobacillus subterraneus]RSD27256.1 polysaccharide biosynthesis tyrosine autokinase [Mesobacillus subterraneus]